MVQNLSQFKRAMKDGQCFEILEHYIHPEFAGQIRKPNYVQTNAFYTVIPGEPESWISKANNGRGFYLEYGKAKDWSFADDGTITMALRGNPVMKIRMIA
ncbi:MAG: peptidylprolyl isomerase [Eubacteriales bacterium]|nr:peptidylprolyl isomerase [Eubacteriales bacterium]